MPSSGGFAKMFGMVKPLLVLALCASCTRSFYSQSKVFTLIIHVVSYRNISFRIFAILLYKLYAMERSASLTSFAVHPMYVTIVWIPIACPVLVLNRIFCCVEVAQSYITPSDYDLKQVFMYCHG